MKTSDQLQNVNNINLPFDEQNPPRTTNTNDRDDDLRDDENALDEEIDERQDWGDVDPAGGDAPAAPGSAV